MKDKVVKIASNKDQDLISPSCWLSGSADTLMHERYRLDGHMSLLCQGEVLHNKL